MKAGASLAISVLMAIATPSIAETAGTRPLRSEPPVPPPQLEPAPMPPRTRSEPPVPPPLLEPAPMPKTFEQKPGKFQIYTFVVNTETGELTSFCSSATGKCMSMVHEGGHHSLGGNDDDRR